MNHKRKILICEDDLKQLLVEFFNKNSDKVAEVYEEPLAPEGFVQRKAPVSDKNGFRATGSCIECRHRRLIHGRTLHCRKKTFEGGVWPSLMMNHTCDLFERREYNHA